MDTFITSAGALALVKSLVDLVKYIRAKDSNGYVTQFVVWLAGIAVTFVIKASDFANDFPVGKIPLHDAKAATVILAGLGLGSAAQLANTGIKAVDGTQTAETPKLLK
jgi:hypothetical protein